MRRAASWLLAVVMLLSLFTGCQKSSENIQTVNPGETTEVNPDPVITDVYTPDCQPVTTDAEIDTLNVVLVIDTSASTLRNDPDRNWIEASCMFLNTLYASANKQAAERLAGSKHANVGVVLYNDIAIQFSESLMNLATKETVDDLKTFVRRARIEGGDDALAGTLEKAVTILNSHRPVKELSERSVILLFTDGYIGYHSDMVAQSNSSINGIPAQYEAIYGVAGINLEGPDPDHPGDKKDYTLILRKQDKDGWANDGAMRNDWYTHEISPGENRNNITTLTIINPEPGTWTIYAKGWDDNRSLHTYAAMVNGAKVNIAFNQGNGSKDQTGEHPVIGGDIAVQVIDSTGKPPYALI